jgi:hypothetical protein
MSRDLVQICDVLRDTLFVQVDRHFQDLAVYYSMFSQSVQEFLLAATELIRKYIFG